MAIRALSWKTVIVLLAGLVSTSGHAMPVVELDANTKRTNLSAVVEYHRDPTGKLSLDQVRRMGPDDWQSSSTSDISFGFTDATYWFRVQLRPADTMPMLIEIGYPSFDHVEMFQVNETGVRHVKTGSKVPLKERAIQSHFPLLPLQVNKDQPADLYLKASNTGSFHLPIRLWDWSAYIMAGSAALLSNGVYFGAWLVVIIFNLVLFAVLRQRALLSLSVFIFSFGLYQISSLGLGSAFIASMPSPASKTGNFLTRHLSTSGDAPPVKGMYFRYSCWTSITSKSSTTLMDIWLATSACETSRNSLAVISSAPVIFWLDTVVKNS